MSRRHYGGPGGELKGAGNSTNQRTFYCRTHGPVDKAKAEQAVAVDGCVYCASFVRTYVRRYYT